MGFDELKVHIKKDGTIEIHIGGEVTKLRHYKEILEEAIGPVLEEIKVPQSSPPPVKQVEKDKIKRRIEQ